MTWRQNLHYKISSQQKLKTDDEYVPKCAQIKLEQAVEKRTKEGEAFQALFEKNSQVIEECQYQLKSLVIDSGDLDIIEKEACHHILRGIGPRHFKRIFDIRRQKRHQCTSMLNRPHRIVQR